MKTGAQLYTVRDYTKTKEDLSETLRKVADIGYQTVQLSATCRFEAEWMAERLRETGLQCVLTHTPKEYLAGDISEVARFHDVIGCRFVGLGFFEYGAGKESTEVFFDRYRKVAQELHAHGKYFMYHNHAGEFQKENGRRVMDILSEGIDPSLMGFTLDTYWVQTGGGDPAEWLLKLRGRVPVIHLKDYAWDGERKMAVVGEGNINFDRVFQAAEIAGTEYMMVEQDFCYGEDPFDCLRRSYEYLKAQGFE